MTVDVAKYGRITVDISYGGAFYAVLPAQRLGLDVKTSHARELILAAAEVKGIQNFVHNTIYCPLVDITWNDLFSLFLIYSPYLPYLYTTFLSTSFGTIYFFVHLFIRRFYLKIEY